MLLKKLKEEYNIRYKIAEYKKLYKTYLYSVIEKNNVALLSNILFELKVSKDIQDKTINFKLNKNKEIGDKEK